MTKRHSIARRLSLMLSGAALAVWIVSVTISGFVLHSELHESFDETMRQSAVRILPLVIHEYREVVEGEEETAENEDADEDRNVVASLTDHSADLDYHVTDHTGLIVILSDEAPSFTIAEPIPEGHSDRADRRLFSLTDDHTGYGIVVSEKVGLRDEVFRESMASMILPLFVLIPLFAFIVYFVVGAAIRPVERLSMAISNRGGRNLAPLREEGLPVELSPIADEVEDLFTRLRAALDAERSFAAEAAHELRTPIAGALAQVQLLSSQAEKPDQKAGLAHVGTALKNLSNLSESLMQFSRLEAGFARSETPTDVGKVTELVLAEQSFRQGGKSVIQLQKRVTDGPMINISADAFAIALRNLLQNAIKYSPDASPVAVVLETHRLVVANDCEPIAPDLLPTLSSRFVRGQTKIGGSGLGLAITQSIAHESGGALVLSSPIHGEAQGFEAEFRFSV